MVRMQSQLAKRYARALFELAEEKQILPDLRADMEHIVSVLETCPALESVLSSPVSSAEETSRLLATFAAQAQLSGLTQNFFLVLVRNRRAGFLPDIASAVLQRLEEHHQIVRVGVTAAVALSPQLMEQLERTLSASLGRTAKIEVTVDPAILGGLIIAVGSKMWDDSVAGKINQVHRAQKQAVAAFK